MVSACGSGMRSRTAGSANSGNRANSRRRPSATEGPRSGPRSLKKRKGSSAPHSWPMNSSGRAGESSRTAVTARTASGAAERGDALPERAVADLVVVLEEAHEGGRRQVAARLPAQVAAIPGALALEREALGEAAPEVRQRRLVVLVVAAALAGERHVERVVHVVVPLGLVEGPPARRALEVAGLVGAVLQDEVHRALAAGPVGHRAAELHQEMRGGVVHDRVDRVEAQAVQVELLEPVERVVDHEGADDLGARPVVVDAVAPERAVVRSEEGGGVAVEVVALRDRSGCRPRRGRPRGRARGRHPPGP